ncbi:MAG: sigma-54 dependent transcriptional regulator [Planctomycetota bacterium]
MLGKSAAMTELRKQIAKLADSDLPVLVQGETGSGKELVARALHEQSARAGAAFVAENCSAIPGELMESELFGHCKGAFTGADEDRAGLLELASDGTLFLDEVGDMPLELQAKLLRALQEGRVRRIGASASVPVNFRLITATHKDLQQMVADRRFRADLFYRVAAAEVAVPPLRERGRDVLLLAEHFLAQLNERHRRQVAMSDAAWAQLQSYPWPGNVRELEHVVSRAFLLVDGDTLDALQLPEPVLPSDAAGSPTRVLTLAEAEEQAIQAALAATNGDKTKAARLLRISRTAIYAKLGRIRDAKRAPDPPGDE